MRHLVNILTYDAQSCYNITMNSPLEKSFEQASHTLLLMRHIIGQTALKFAEIVDPAIRFDRETDTLSGLNTFDAFKCKFETTVKNNRRARPGNAKDYLLLADLDNFGQFNKENGHQYGDRVIRNVGSRIKENIRAEDFACRRSGDEFMVMFRNAVSLEPIIRNLQHMNEGICTDYQQLTSVSMGIVEVRRGEEFSVVHSLADEALMQVKAAGRNGIQIYDRASDA